MPTVYRSTDVGAPGIDGQAGSLIAVLDACLVNGYGSQAAAGWTKPFAAANKGVYLGTGHYLDVDDSGAGVATTQEATVRGYESMTAVATGTNPFPTVAQAAAPGLYIRKSATATATARAWMLLADGETFHLFILTGDTAGRYRSFSFGRFYSFLADDAYRSCILGHTTSGTGSSGLDIGTLASGASSAISGVIFARNIAGTVGALAGGLVGVGSAIGSGPYNGPNPADARIYLSRLFCSGASAAEGLRGYVRGLYQIVTAVGLADGDTFSGAGEFAGRSFLVLNRTAGGGYLALETSAWDSSS